MRIKCHNCESNITTDVRKEISGLQWILSGFLCIMGCVPCCIIPLFIDNMKEVTHTCPNCNIVLGNNQTKPVYMSYPTRHHRISHYGNWDYDYYITSKYLNFVLVLSCFLKRANYPHILFE